MKRIKYMFNLVLCLLSIGLAAQDLSSEQLERLGAIAYFEESPDWLTFHEGLDLSPSQVFVDYPDAFGLGLNHKMRLVKTETDRIGLTHYYFQQYYHNYPIQGAEFIIHTKDGQLKTANGKLARNLNKTNVLLKNYQQFSTNGISEAVAFRNALQYADGTPIRPSIEDKHSRYTSEVGLKGNLVWVLKKGKTKFIAQNLVLAWRFDIHTEAGEARRIFIHVEAGDLVKYYSLSHSGCTIQDEGLQDEMNKVSIGKLVARNLMMDSTCTPGEGNATWAQQLVSFETDERQTGDFRLFNDCYGFSVHLRDMMGGTLTGNATEFLDENNDWSNYNQKAAIQTWWSIDRTLDKFVNGYGRNSYNNNGGRLFLYNNAQFKKANGRVYGDNAMAGGRTLTFGQGKTDNPTDDFNPLDIVAHEYTHLVDINSVRLTYEGESGALSEGFADIFGEIVEDVSYRDELDWLVAAERLPIRSLSNPNDYSDPDTYEGDYWVDPRSKNDKGGVHTNSGVLNFCFYLLSEGGVGTNDNGDNYRVTSIGIEKAGEIAFQTLTSGYLTSTSNFNDARKAFHNAAKDLYGDCSFEALQVLKAFYAVGVGRDEATSRVIQLTGSSPNLYLQNNQQIQAIHTIKVTNTSLSGSIHGHGSLKAGKEIIIEGGRFQTRIFSGTIFNSSPNDIVRVFVDGCKEEVNARNASERANQFGKVYKKVFNEKEDFNPILPANTSKEAIVTDLFIYPNPFKEDTNFSFYLQHASKVNISIYDGMGKVIFQINKSFGIGHNIFEFKNSKRLPAGIYTVQMNIGIHTLNQRMIVIR